VLLGGYAAKRCPVRVHNDLSPAVQTLEWVPSPEDQARLDAGRAFEAAVFTQLMALHPGCVLVDPDLRKDEAIAATVAAIDAGVGLIQDGQARQEDGSCAVTARATCIPTSCDDRCLGATRVIRRSGRPTLPGSW
jgi:hypothetical protein